LALAAIPTGRGQFEAAQIEVFTYKPAAFRNGPMLVVFHGMSRNADEYRDHAMRLADRFNLLVVAPRFDCERFPNSRYNRGGLLVNGQLAPRGNWTWSLIPKIMEEVRRQENRPAMPYYFIGHSAGAQFAQRMAAFLPTDARRIVIANAGVHLAPTRELPFPFGFGGLPPALSGDESLRRYLAQPLTIYLGTADTLRDDELYVSTETDQLGNNRYERGMMCFRMGEKLARERGWAFNWRLVTAPDVGHDHQAMFDSEACGVALFGDRLADAAGKSRVRK
jgi:pimeloyl-ACP methyl ester carboxylesterase